MRSRIGLALYVALVLAVLPGIDTADTWRGSLVIVALAALALLLGCAAIKGLIGRYAPEVALLAAVPYGMAILATDPSWQILLVPVYAVLGEQLAAGEAKRSRRAPAESGEQAEGQ